jgi:phospholipid/cholesterol/gamma-HCH transport system ATP-binding protein
MSLNIDVTPAIELRHVTKRFESRQVLDDITLSIPARRGLCLLGRSGTGKSVTLKHIVGLITPDAGEILVEGKNIVGMTSRQLSPIRQRIGFLFQNAALFDSLTVGENVAFPLRRHTTDSNGKIIDRARALLAQVGLEGDYGKMPADLSGGMKKRAGLARAMALDPPILLVDEPSAGLDPVTSAEIDALLIDLKERLGTTLVVVTHNIPSARALGDELVFLHDAKILAQGSPDRLDRCEHPLVRDFMRSGALG